MNAFNDGTKIHFDTPEAKNNMFPFFPDIHGAPFNPMEAQSRLTRWTVDMESNSGAFEKQRAADRFRRRVSAHRRALHDAALSPRLAAGFRRRPRHAQRARPSRPRHRQGRKLAGGAGHDAAGAVLHPALARRRRRRRLYRADSAARHRRQIGLAAVRRPACRRTGRSRPSTSRSACASACTATGSTAPARAAVA